MEIKDSLTLDASGLNRVRDDYLVADARVSRAGNVQEYYGYEIGLTGDDANQIFGVYRDPEVVFDEASMMSLAGRPVTRNHPPNGVNAKTWRDLSVGHMGGRVVRDGEHVVASMAVMDADAISEIEAGARSLSAGYTVGIVKDEGVSPSGEAYQYRQSGPLRFNHVAYLPDNNPRAGNTRIGDAASRNWGAAPITPSRKDDSMSNALISVVLGDKAVSVSADAARDIEAFKADQAKALSDAEAKHAAEITKKDEEIGTLKADNKKLEDDAMTPEKVSKLVADRVALEADAKKIAKDVDTKGLSDADVRKAAVAAACGDDMVKDASADEIAGMFKAEVRRVGDTKSSPYDHNIQRQASDDGAAVWDKLTKKKEA